MSILSIIYIIIKEIIPVIKNAGLSNIEKLRVIRLASAKTSASTAYGTLTLVSGGCKPMEIWR